MSANINIKVENHCKGVLSHENERGGCVATTAKASRAAEWQLALCEVLARKDAGACLGQKPLWQAL